MSTASREFLEGPPPADLHSGDRMTRKEFHDIYKNMPEDFKAELIGSVVYVSSPLKQSHGKSHLCLGTIFGTYVAHTPGVSACDNATIILSEEDEPQPDLFLRVEPEYGGQSQDTLDEYVKGAPELIAEIAYSSRAIDLHSKRQRYAQTGVIEYIVVCLLPRQLYWFNLQSGEQLDKDHDGAFRSKLFPGLWIHDDALLQLDYKQSLSVLNEGLASPEHAAFVERLAKARS